jgi:putative tryptophan/tyrosine transport system substrate-binding protein
VAQAQQRAKLPRIGFLGLVPEFVPGDGLRSGLHDLGYVEGSSIVIEWRWAKKVEELPALAAELVSMPVDVIFAPSSTFVEAARQATTTIPIVFAVHADPVGLGHVAGLARPGGNITGMSMLLTELVAKGLEMMTEALPQAHRIGVLWNPTTPSHARALQSVETAAEKLGLTLQMVPARSLEDFDGAFATMAQERVGGDASQGGAQHAHRICYASCRSSQPMVVAAIGVAAMSADARSQLRKYRNQPVMAPTTNHSGIERTTKNTTHAPS